MAQRFISRYVALVILCVLSILVYTRRNSQPVRQPSFPPPASDEALEQVLHVNHGEPKLAQAAPPRPPAAPRPPLQGQYTRALVLPRTLKEASLLSTDWTHTELSTDPSLSIYIYTVDDPSSPNTVPANKGHEVMAYLTYIITHYDTLPDVSVFTHAHRHAWHNNDLHDSDMAQMVLRLSTPTVLRQGFFSLRCHLDPGCPAHIHPANMEWDASMPEQREIANAWPRLFPGEPVPRVLSAPCCSQFAVSRDALRGLPVGRYEELRRWVLETPLDDIISGRVFEYVWQKLWTGKDELCPQENVCYCDGYGICFGGKKEYYDWVHLRARFRDMQPYLELISQLEQEGKVGAAGERDPELLEHAVDMGIGAFNPPKRGDDWERQLMEQARAMVPPGMAFEDWCSEYRRQARELRGQLEKERADAIERGNDPRMRALEVGREWKEGDGY